MVKLEQVFRAFLNSILEVLPNAIAGIIVLALFSIAGTLLGKFFDSKLQKKWEDPLVANFLAGSIKWIFITIGFISALHFVGFGGIASSILAGAGISALIIGFAFKDIAENFLAGILLAVNRPFKMGDIIETEKFKGPVKKLDLRVTHIRTADGRDIYIPNSMIVKNVLINYTKDGLIRQEFSFGLDTFDDLSKARNLILHYFTTQKDILKNPKPNFLVDEIGESSIVVRILFWIDVFKLQSDADNGDVSEGVKSKVIREIKELLIANEFNLPSLILEHKMYKENSPISIQLKKD